MVQNSLINLVLLCFNNITLFTKVLVPILLSKMSQFEMLYGHAPSLCHIRVIRCLCYTTTLPKQDKFAPRAIKCVFLGYDIHQKGYKVYNLANKSYFISRDVIFYEDKFLFQSPIPEVTPRTGSSFIYLTILSNLLITFLMIITFLLLSLQQKQIFYQMK